MLSSSDKFDVVNSYISTTRNIIKAYRTLQMSKKTLAIYTRSEAELKNLESITLFNCDAITCEGLRFVLRYCIELQDIDIWSCKNFSGEIKSVPEAFMYVSSSSGDTSSISRVDTGDLARISKALDNISKRLSI